MFVKYITKYSPFEQISQHSINWDESFASKRKKEKRYSLWTPFSSDNVTELIGIQLNSTRVILHGSK